MCNKELEFFCLQLKNLPKFKRSPRNFVREMKNKQIFLSYNISQNIRMIFHLILAPLTMMPCNI